MTRHWVAWPKGKKRPKKPKDEQARILALKRRNTKTTPQGFAFPERIAYLKETVGDRMGWVEVYEQDHHRPDRYGNITDDDIARARLEPYGGEWNALRLELQREYCLARWRAWLDQRFYASPEAARRAQKRAADAAREARKRREAKE